MTANNSPRTLAEKVWGNHLIKAGESGAPDLLYIDLHLLHEVTSPQAFDGLRAEGRQVRRPDLTLATEDHNVPTLNINQGIKEPMSRLQVETLRKNCAEFGIQLYSLGSENQGIVHVISPGLGLTQPSMTIACGDSHTSTHGAFGSIGIGIGTSEIEEVLATQTLRLQRFKNLAVNVEGTLRPGVTAKDIILAIIAKLGTNGASGHIIEYRGSTIRNLSMAGRMTICNMSIEAGARAGMVAPDAVTYAYLRDKPHAPQGTDWDAAVAYWQTLTTDANAVFDMEIDIDADTLEPYATWGTNPGHGVHLNDTVPTLTTINAMPDVDRATALRALDYMGLEPGTPMKAIRVDAVFMGSCTNSRVEDLREFANIIRGRHKAAHVTVTVVPGSVRVKLAAEAEGIDQIVRDFGGEWRGAGCSACLGMNEDVYAPRERVASTSNRNFEGRQGRGARTHLVSPVVAAATAIMGTLATPGDLTTV